MNSPLNIARGLGALFLGFLVLASLDTILTALTLKFFFASAVAAPMTATQMVGLLAIKVLAGLLAGYLSATLAASHRWQHALVLAVLILCIGLLGLLALRGVPRSDYTTYALIVSPLSILIGGWLRARKAS